MTAPTRREPGRHRATTVPSYWDRPGERRHLVGTPGFDWFTAQTPDPGPYAPVPPVLPPGETDDVETTGTFSLAELGAATGATLLPAALAGPDPEPTGPLPCWATGPQPIVAPPRADDEPSMWPTLGAIGAVFGVAALAVVVALLRVALGAS